jgi:acetyl/propionyl-CoA carboxylase alpha subunit
VEIRKLLVANRGEIAVRVFATCKRIGIATVAVAAPDDEGAFHTRRADEVSPVTSYLDADALVGAAKAAEADAVHPGYGFLAENGEFAEAVSGAGLTWIGPPAPVLRAAGDKLQSKRLAADAGVPVVETGEPSEIGYPLMIKAAAGGGGRGMRVVHTPEELDEAFAAARREAESAFGDDTVFCERYVERPRHVEVQLLADTAGEVTALGERECSIQRRHQKVLEESPSPAVDEELRSRLEAAATAFARAAGYVGAGTAEFMLDGERFYFLELNARIQVEHPVTEAVTGIDIVEQQLDIARGGTVRPAPQLAGHAIEARLYAEHPLTFLPQAGRIERLALPDDVRVDAGVQEGDDVPVAYDPLIAKLIAMGETREEALEQLASALKRTDVDGVVTNLPFLRWLVVHPDVRAGDTTTAFLAENPPLSRPLRSPRPWKAYWRLNQDRRTPPARRPPPLVESFAHAAGPGGGEASVVSAPMPGVVLRVLAREGERVESRQPLVLLEAMKMETPLVSPYDAVVRRILVTEGERVAGGAALVELDE